MPYSPVRIITKVYEKDGTVIAENDPCTEFLTQLDAVHFATYCADKNYPPNYITIKTLYEWMDTIYLKTN